jgi:hypothetical protein
VVVALLAALLLERESNAKVQRVNLSRKAKETAPAGSFLGGDMTAFYDAVMGKPDATGKRQPGAPEEDLIQWEQQLISKPSNLEEIKWWEQPVLYCFVTDRRMTTKQRRIHQVLALAGHPLASRMAIMDENQHETFYGIANALQRRVAHILP